MSQAVSTAAAKVTVTDERGRVFTLKRPNVLRQLDLVEMVGDSAENRLYMAMVTPVVYLTEIDGEPEPAPTSKIQLRALLQRLDDEGLAALAKGVRDNFMPASAEEAADLQKKS